MPSTRSFPASRAPGLRGRKLGKSGGHVIGARIARVGESYQRRRQLLAPAFSTTRTVARAMMTEDRDRVVGSQLHGLKHLIGSTPLLAIDFRLRGRAAYTPRLSTTT